MATGMLAAGVAHALPSQESAEETGMLRTKPVTELGNVLSQDLDLQSPQGIVRILETCDNEMFYGYSEAGKKHTSLYSPDVLESVCAVSDIAARIIEDPQDKLIVLSGCGTSGRLAFLTTRIVNKWLVSTGRKPVLDYVMAGSDKALFTSQESQEDDYEAGVTALKKMCSSKRQILYIGVTCGLSAPFVAGQVDYCLSHLETFTPVLIGFNPADRARHVPIKNWDKTFYEVVRQLTKAAEDKKAFLINPVVGPEAVRGSSRMKGGSATMMILSAIFVSRPQGVRNNFERNDVKRIFDAFKLTMQCVYSASTQISRAISMAAESVTGGGQVIYLGSGGTGIMAMIDASECVPTYGVSAESFRGYLNNGYEALRNREGDLSHVDGMQPISLDYFQYDIAPGLGINDLVIAITSFAGSDDEDEVEKALKACIAKKVLCRLVLIDQGSGCSAHENFAADYTAVTSSSQPAYTMSMTLPVPCAKAAAEVWDTESMASGLAALQCYLLQYVTKLFCNAISTGSHVIMGKVYKNVMVDLRVSNAKLLERAASIVEEVGGCHREDARRHLVQSIVEGNLNEAEANQGLADTPQSADTLILLAARRNKVVPTAIAMALTGLTYAEASRLLSSESSIRNCIARQKK